LYRDVDLEPIVQHTEMKSIVTTSEVGLHISNKFISFFFCLYLIKSFHYVFGVKNTFDVLTQVLIKNYAHEYAY